MDCNEDMLCADPVQDVEIASIISHPSCKYSFLNLVENNKFIKYNLQLTPLE